MNTTQYAAYQKAVANFLTINQVKPGCHSPVEEQSEPFFSWRACECCGSRLGGNRETYSFAPEIGETFTADICTDCVYYLAYGQLDDMTMMDMDNA